VKRTQITSRDNTKILTLGNKNLHANNRNITTRNLETQEISPDRSYNPLINRNSDRAEEKLYTPSKSFAAVINKTNPTINNDASEFTGLMSEIQKQTVNIPHMIKVIRNLNNRLANCNDGMEKLQVFIEAADLLDRNG